MNKDYVFSINWEDRFKNVHKIGVLAQLDEEFYLIVKDNKKAYKAHENGFDGLPGFKAEKVYKSQELFDFFKNRVLRTANMNYCEELRKTGAKSMIDSFSVEEMPEEVIKEKKSKILKAYDLQEKMKIGETVK